MRRIRLLLAAGLLLLLAGCTLTITTEVVLTNPHYRNGTYTTTVENNTNSAATDVLVTVTALNSSGKPIGFAQNVIDYMGAGTHRSVEVGPFTSGVAGLPMHDSPASFEAKVVWKTNRPATMVKM